MQWLCHDDSTINIVLEFLLLLLLLLFHRCMHVSPLEVITREIVYRQYIHCMCLKKNETRVILNILYSCKSIAMKFSM